MDTAKHFQNGLTEIVEIRHTVRIVEFTKNTLFKNIKFDPRAIKKNQVSFVSSE
jgi:hypothetical protein